MINSTHCAFMAKQACATFSKVVQKITPPIANNFLKFFFALFATLTLGVGNAWGETVTFTPSNCTNWTASQVEQSQTIDGITLHSTKAANTSDQLRLYADNTHTITSTVGNITSIVFTCTTNGTANYGPGKMSGDGYVASSGKTGEWTGNSTKVTLTGGQSRCTSIVVTYTPTGGGETPPSEGGDDSDEPGTGGDSDCVWQLVSDASTLAVGDEIIIAAKDYDYALSTNQKSNNRGQTSITKKGDNISEKSSDVQIITLETGKVANTFAFNTGSAGYLYAASSSNNYLRTKTTLDDNGSWGITITKDGTFVAASGTNTCNQLNYNQSSSLFSCYPSDKLQKPIVLYKKVCAVAQTYSVKKGTLENCTLKFSKTEDNFTNDELTGLAEKDYVYFTITPSSGYELKGEPVIKDASDNILECIEEDGVWMFEMPASDVTVSVSCVLTVKTYTITIASDIQNGSVSADKSSAVEGATITLTVTPADGYMLNTLTVADESSNSISVTDNKFEMPASNVTVSATFKEIPAATLTLSKNGVEEALEGEHKVGDVVTLPSFTSDCVKQFVGWSADANCATTPEYAPGADFTLTAEEHILYAVYATAAEGELTSIFSETFDACNGTGGNDGKWSGNGVAQGDLPDELSSTWTFIKGTKANECAKFGTGSVKGSAQTPAITLNGDATLTFKAAAWSGDGKTLNLSATGATLGELSVTLKEAEWTEYTVAIQGATGSVNIKFEAKNASDNRFFLDDVVVSQGSITYSDYSTTCVVAPDAPEFSVAAGTYNAAQTVTITAEDGATIYYTLNGNNPTNESNVYSSALTISETTTLKAIAVKDGLSSAITTATYTIKLPLTTIDQIFAKAKEVDGTATAVEITMGGWTVSGANDKNVFVTDGTKGFIIYKSDGGHGFNVGDVLSGTVACKVQLFKGSAELTELTSTTSGLDVTTGGTVTPVTLDAAGITALTGVNTGSVIKINGTCTLEDSKYYVAGVQLYNTLYKFQTLEPSAEYNVTGVYQLYTTTKEILPRQEADIEKIESLPTATISIADITMEVEETKTITATIYPAAAADAVVYSTTSSCISISGNTITGVTEGTATVTATIANADGEYYGTTKDFKVTVTPKSTKQNVVILAEYNGKWYAMTNECTDSKQMGALEVDYQNGVLFNVDEATKATITWELAIADGKATFKNNNKYLIGGTSTTLNYANSKFEWVVDGDKYLSDSKTRSFMYNKAGYFKNYAISNVGKSDYSGLPVVTAPVYVNLNTASVKTVENAYFSVGSNKYVQFSTGNLQYEVGTNTWSFASEQYEVIGGEAYDPANPTNTNYGMNEPGYTGKLDLFGWSSDGKFGVNPSNTDDYYEQAFVDWGKLVNETGWYTLTKEEMNYILNRKKDGKKLWALATVCNMNGLILLPDNWNTSTTLEYGYVPANFNYTKNQIDAAAWAALEAAGAVFLPEGGSRVGGHGNKDNATGPSLDTPGATDAHGHYFHVDNVGEMGYYWLNTQDTRTGYENCASFLILPGWSDNGTPNDESDDKAHAPQVWSREKRRGNSVRLVKEVTPNYTRDKQGAGVYGTVCYPENIVWVDGATLYKVAGKEGNKVIFDEVTTPEAGMPYIFIAEQEVINFFCGTEYEGTAGKYNSLQGTFDDIAPSTTNILVGNYMLVNNIIKKCGVDCGLNAYRAYFVATELENMGTAPAAVQGRRRISLNVTSENTTTGLDNITNGENTTIKVIENGQLIIIRDGIKYNAQGVRL